MVQAHELSVQKTKTLVTPSPPIVDANTSDPLAPNDSLIPKYPIPSSPSPPHHHTKDVTLPSLHKAVPKTQTMPRWALPQYSSEPVMPNSHINDHSGTDNDAEGSILMHILICCTNDISSSQVYSHLLSRHE